MQKEETQINEQKGDNNTGTEQVADIELPEEIELTQKQEKFCRLYTQNSELFGNGTLAYSEAYGYDLDSLSRANELDENGKEIRLTSEYDKAYSVCAVGASRLLRKIKIGEKITEFLNELMKDNVVDAQLAKVIMQDYKLEAKVSAIKEYNKLKQRITDKSEVDVKGLTVKQYIYGDNDTLQVQPKDISTIITESSSEPKV